MEDATPGTISSALNQATTVSGTNPDNGATLTCNAQGAASATVYLASGQSITITGLPKNADYTITEAKEDYTITSIVQTGETDGTKDLTEGTYTDPDITADTTVTFTNTKEGTIPTGVLLSVAAPAVVGAGVLGLIVSLTVKRKKRENEE